MEDESCSFEPLKTITIKQNGDGETVVFKNKTYVF